MNAVTIGTIGEFNDNVEDVCTYLELLDVWMAANGILSPSADDAQATDRRVCIFLSVVGPKVYAMIRNLLSPEKPSEQTFERLRQTMTNHYKPQRVIIAERFRFNKRNQGDSESVADYIVALKQLASSCEF